MSGLIGSSRSGRVPAWPLRRFGAIVVLALVLAALPALAGAQDRWIPPSPAPAPAPEVITLEGFWGYPCLIGHRDCLPSPEDDWVPLEVAAWRGDEKYTGDFTSIEGDRFGFEVTIAVPPGQGADLVMLEVTARAPAPATHTARFTHILDVAHRLQAEADGEGRVLRTAARPRMLTILTTALTGLLEEANGGDWRMDAATLAERLWEVDPARVMRHAIAFQGLVSGTLPGAGSVDPNQLVADSAAVEAYLADVPQVVIDQIFAQFQGRGRVAYQPVDFDALDVSMVPPAAAGTVAFGRRAGIRLRAGDSWNTQGGGSSVIDTGFARGVDTFILEEPDSYSHAARLIRVQNPSFETQRITYDCPGEGEVQAIRLMARSPEKFRRMAMAAAAEFVEYTEHRSLSYLPLEGTEVPCVDELPTFEAGVHYLVGYPLQARGRTYLSTFSGPVALQLLNPDPDLLEEDSNFIAGTIDLATGTVDAPGYAASGTVERDPAGVATLVVDALPGTLHEGELRVRVEGVRGDGLGAQEWVVSTRVDASADDHARGHVTPAVRVDPNLVLAPALLDGSWRSGSDLSVPGALEALALAFDAATGDGEQQVPGEAAVPFSWQVEDGAMRASTFALDADPGNLLARCPPAASDCNEVLRRIWTPLRLGTRDALVRLYVIEERFSDEGDGLVRRSRQLNFYDADPVGP